tara:strand:- start:6179 stop:6448 length:270 start_codon:yes stop_codon:yes gene_type:complete
MGFYYKTDEQKKQISKQKVNSCDNFSQFLTENRIRHNVFNNGYHIQTQVQHNFYPSKGTYYNSESGKKFGYPKFKDVNAFLQFLGKYTK